MGIFFLSQGFQLKILDIYQEPVPMPVIWSLGNCVPMAKLFKSELHQICYLPWSNLCNLFLDERVSPRVFFGKTRTFSLRSVRIVRNLSQQRWVDSTINVKVRKSWGGGGHSWLIRGVISVNDLYGWRLSLQRIIIYDSEATEGKSRTFYTYYIIKYTIYV
jgi:hypothetical protein